MASTKKKRVVTISQSCGNFSSALHKILTSKSEENIVNSPLSAHILLSYLLHGCYGETAEEIMTSLSLPHIENLDVNYQQLIESLSDIPKNMYGATWGVPELKRDEDDPVIIFANSLFLQNNIPLEENFATTGKDFFEFTVQNVNFDDKDVTAELINSWVSEKTNNVITKVIDPASIRSFTKLTLVNTIYMKAQWSKQFGTHATKDEPFHVNTRLTKQVPTMHQTDIYDYGTIPSWKSRFIHKPYEEGDLDMIIILPDEIDGLEFVEKRFDWDVISKAKKEPREIVIHLPKFKIETEIDLEAAFRKMGMKSMFEPKGDFEGICPIPMDPPLKVDGIIQKCSLEVTEKGTIAAAATYARIVGGGLPLEIDEFYVDRPFMIIIRHVPSNIPLFVSSVKDIGDDPQPTEKKLKVEKS